ncbi:MAG: hypothetical protein DLM70_07370, partial [Chloroflexi bacterium]
LAWVKPPVALPIVLLIVLFHAPARKPMVAGFATATASLLGLTLVTTGWRSLAFWVTGLLSYSHDITIQHEMPSISGLYVMWAPPALRLTLMACQLGGAAALTAVWWWRRRNQTKVAAISVAWLWFVWFLASPYVHFGDEVLLAVPLLALLGREADRITHRLPVFALYMVFFSPLLIIWTPHNLQLLGLMLAPAGIAAYLAARSPRYRLESAADGPGTASTA